MSHREINRVRTAVNVIGNAFGTGILDHFFRAELGTWDLADYAANPFLGEQEEDDVMDNLSLEGEDHQEANVSPGGQEMIELQDRTPQPSENVSAQEKHNVPPMI